MTWLADSRFKGPLNIGWTAFIFVTWTGLTWWGGWPVEGLLPALGVGLIGVGVTWSFFPIRWAVGAIKRRRASAASPPDKP